MTSITTCPIYNHASASGIAFACNHNMQPHNHTLRQTSLDMLSIIDDIPTLPDRFMKIQEVLDDPKSTLDDLTAIIETDQATTAILLKIVNSSYYNPLGASVNSLAYAISRLGRQETGDIALSISLLYGFAVPASIGVIRNFWAHAFAVAQINRYLATHSKQTNTSPDMLFIAGLLHDIGRIILSMRIDMSYFEKGFPMADEKALLAAEQEAYGIDHAEAGKIVLKLWNIPSEIHHIVGSHHTDNPSAIDIQICQFADTFAAEHFSNTQNIEDVQVKLKEGLLEQAYEYFCKTIQS